MCSFLFVIVQSLIFNTNFCNLEKPNEKILGNSILSKLYDEFKSVFIFLIALLHQSIHENTNLSILSYCV